MTLIMSVFQFNHILSNISRSLKDIACPHHCKIISSSHIILVPVKIENIQVGQEITKFSAGYLPKILIKQSRAQIRVVIIPILVSWQFKRKEIQRTSKSISILEGIAFFKVPKILPLTTTAQQSHFLNRVLMGSVQLLIQYKLQIIRFWRRMVQKKAIVPTVQIFYKASFVIYIHNKCEVRKSSAELLSCDFTPKQLLQITFFLEQKFTLRSTIMDFQVELLQLIKQRSPEVDTLRLKAINGNQNLLQSFSRSIIKLLKNEQNHQLAYDEINKLLISAKPNVASHVNSHIIPTVAISHNRKELDQYILLWRKIMPGSNQRLAYPNLKSALKNVKTVKSIQESSKFIVENENQFSTNAKQIAGERVEFFEDFSQSSFTELNNDEDQQDIVLMDIEQLKEIRKILQQGPVKDPVLQQYLKKAKNFLHLRPQQKIKQSRDYQDQLAWVKQFIPNYKSHSIINEMIIENDSERIPVSAKMPIQMPFHNNQSMKSVRIGNEVEQVQYLDEKSKRMESKRFTLASEKEKVGQFTKKPNKVDEAPLKKDQSTPMLHHFSLPVPKFIQDTDEMKRMNNENSPMRNSSSRARPKIFSGNNSRMSQNSQMIEEPREEFLKVTKHGKRPDNSKDHQKDNNAYGSQQNLMTPVNINRNRLLDTVSPNTAFQNRTAYSETGFKKLSDFKQEKMQRKLALHNEELTEVQSYLYTPYYQHVNDVITFSRFRRNCLSNNFLLYANSLLTISCFVQRISDSKIKLQINYQNKSHSNLSIQTLYRIPKCVKIEKYSQINKRWALRDENIHAFGMQLLQFPLEPCLINLKYCLEADYVNLKQERPTVISIPVTIRNFINYLVLSPQQWVERWTSWSSKGNFRKIRNIILDGLVSHEDDLASTLSDFTILAPIQRYSVKQFGGYCSQSNFDGLTFLLRISQRVENIITLQLLASRKQVNTNEIEYLEYCLGVWSMLLAKI